MPAAKPNLSIEQGATFAQQLIWQQSDGEPVDLSGYAARMQIRPSVRSADVLLELNTENGGLALWGSDGSVTIAIDELVSELPAFA